MNKSSHQQPCSRCRRTRHVRFFHTAKDGVKEKICTFCKSAKRKRIIEKRVARIRCGQCKNPPTKRDIVHNEGRMTMYKGKRLCAECLVPHLTDEEIKAWALYRIFDKIEYAMDYHEPDTIDWFGEGA